MRAVALVLLFCTAVPLIAATNPPRPKDGPPEDITEFPEYPEQGPARPAGFEDAEYFWFNDNTGTQQWADPNPVRTDESTGKKMYTDPKTGQQTAEQPADAAWEGHWDEELQQEYYFNVISKESTWKLPDAFAWHKVWVDHEGNVIAPPIDAEDEDEDLWEDEEDSQFAEFEDEGAYDTYDHHEELHDDENVLEEEAEEAALREEAAEL